MRKLMAVAVLALAGCRTDSPVAPRSLPHHPALTVAPTGATATLTACDGKLAGVYVAWTVVPGATVTYVTIGAYDAVTGALLYTANGATGRLASYASGASGTWVPFGTFDIRVYNWEPDGVGGLTKSAPAVIPMTVAKRDCPHGKG